MNAPQLITGAVAVADVVVTSMEGGLSHLGIGEEEVRRMNPSVIHASVSPFGTTGPYATWKSSSLLDWAASGYLFITGDPDREPLAGPEGICEAVCAYTAAMAIEAALAARRNTGQGLLHRCQRDGGDGVLSPEHVFSLRRWHGDGEIGK